MHFQSLSAARKFQHHATQVAGFDFSIFEIQPDCWEVRPERHLPFLWRLLACWDVLLARHVSDVEL
jgi:hypothetical protein